MNRVFAYHPETLEQMMYFNSAAEAARALNVDEGEVRRAAIHNKECGAWLLSYMPEMEIERYVIRDEMKRVVGICKSLREAAAVINCSHESVRQAVKKHRPTKGRTVELEVLTASELAKLER